jgi:hypothetical protein
MILSNFTPIGSVGKHLDEILLAEVTVTTGFWLWRRVEVREVFRGIGESWKFADTGKYCPGNQCGDLDRANRGKEAFARYYEDHR